MTTESPTPRTGSSRRVTNRIQRIFTQAHVSLYRLTGGRLLGGKHVLILMTVGRKSGKEHSTPVFNFRDGDNYIVVASNGGAPTHPTWWLNLQAHPQAKIQVGPRVMTVTAKTADAEERQRLWSIIETNYKNFVTYMRRTSREIPIVILSPDDLKHNENAAQSRAGARLMSFTSRIIGLLMHLSPAQTHKIDVTHDIPVHMADGVVLLADHYAPRSDVKLPTILIRTPYGRKGLFSLLNVLPYAKRGYQVLIQSCRGTAGSGGDFRYARHEHDDGLATIEWMKEQEWFSGELAMLGASYLGFVQWAIAADVGPEELKAIIPQVTSSDFNHFRSQGGSFNLETSLGWSTMMTAQAATGMRLGSILLSFRQSRLLERAYRHLPLGEADRLVVHQPSQSFQEHLLHEPEDDYWKPVDFSSRIAEVNVPTYLMGGWYDLFLDWQLKDYQALRKAGKQPYLLIGPWTHTSFSGGGIIVRQSLAWLDAHVKGRQAALNEMPVQLFVMGANTWRHFADWPPSSHTERWFLQGNSGLATTPPTDVQPDTYRYDSANPTPAVGGNSLGAAKHMGPKDNRSLEARADVLVYTSAILKQDMEVIEPITAELYVRSSLEHTDFFARLCVVEESGKSINLCDGILRLTPGSIAPEPDGSLHIFIEVWPTAYHFRKGQRIRVQVSSGAHPRFVRNAGSGEPLATGTKLLVADQVVYHDPEHPSAILLPIVSA